MRFEPRAFTLAKDAEHPEENQDAYRIDAGRAVAAIADGVASGIFSGQWADILVEAAVRDTPDPLDKPAFARWLAERRATWEAQVDVSRLAWFQKPKLREGAFSTLLCVRLLAGQEDRPGEPPHVPSPRASAGGDAPTSPHTPPAQETCRLQGFALGDSCLFCVRQGRVLRTFPLHSAKELEADPVVLGSVDLNRDGLLAFASLDEECRAGDLLVLSTDAVAEWALKRRESGDPPRWEDYWEMPEDAWRQEVAALRRERRMRYDDATLVLLRVCRQAAPAPEDSDRTTGTPASAETARTADSPPLPAVFSQWEWRDRLRSLSGRLADQVGEQVSRGVKKFKEVRASAEAAVRKYRDRRRNDQQP